MRFLKIPVFVHTRLAANTHNNNNNNNNNNNLLISQLRQFTQTVLQFNITHSLH
jgi:hypothetical protein